MENDLIHHGNGALSGLEPASTQLRPSDSPKDAAQLKREQELADATLDLFSKSRPRRTLGLHIFDWSVYSINNFLVFGVSVLFTFLTLHGNTKRPDGSSKYTWVGEKIHARGDWLIGKAEKPLGSRKAAEYASMVFFSFTDGSIFAIMVKLLENKRSQIAQWIDEKFGTKHPDQSVYAAEPHQTWGSVAAGRALTMGVVLPTAVGLSKIKYKGESLNDRFFYNPGEWLGTKAAKIPLLQKAFGDFETKELTRVSIFELFYTTVCTVGLFFTSRFVARKFETHDKKEDLIKELQEFQRERVPGTTPTVSQPAQPAEPHATQHTPHTPSPHPGEPTPITNDDEKKHPIAADHAQHAAHAPHPTIAHIEPHGRLHAQHAHLSTAN